jgi:hypothetical protein
MMSKFSPAYPQELPEIHRTGVNAQMKLLSVDGE